MLLMLLNDALCPQIRHTLWLKKTRELSLLKLVRHFQALAERWMQAIFQSELNLHRFLKCACATAELHAYASVGSREAAGASAPLPEDGQNVSGSPAVCRWRR
jgi:hypothetical protein